MRERERECESECVCKSEWVCACAGQYVVSLNSYTHTSKFLKLSFLHKYWTKISIFL